MRRRRRSLGWGPERRGPWRGPRRGPSRDPGRGPRRDLGRGLGRDLGRGLGRDPGRGPVRDLGRGPGREAERRHRRSLSGGSRGEPTNLFPEPKRGPGRDPGGGPGVLEDQAGWAPVPSRGHVVPLPGPNPHTRGLVGNPAHHKIGGTSITLGRPSHQASLVLLKVGVLLDVGVAILRCVGHEDLQDTGHQFISLPKPARYCRVTLQLPKNISCAVYFCEMTSFR